MRGAIKLLLALNEGVGGFDPATLFVGGIPGIAVDTLNPAKLYQDSARTTLVTAIGDPVGGPLDISGNTKHPAQATAANRPTWDGQGIMFDGSNDGWQTPSIDFSGASIVTVMFGGVKNADTANQVFVELTATAVSNNGGFYVTGKSASMAAALRGSTYVERTFGAWEQSKLGVFWVQFDISQAAVADEIQQTIDGAAPISVNTSSGTTAGTGSFANAVLNIGRRNAASLPLSGAIFRPVIIGRALTASEKAQVADWIGEATEQRAAFSDTPTEFSDSAAPIDEGTFYRTSYLAHADYETDATVLDVDVVTTVTSGDQSGIGVYVDGAFLRNLPTTVPGETRHRVYLPAGAGKEVSVVNGVQGRDSVDLTNVFGVFVKSVHADKALTRLLPAPVDPILIYGDSISVGMNALPNVQNGWVSLLRAAAAGVRSVQSEGWNGRAIWDDASDSTKRAEFVAKIVARNPTTLVIETAVNDYIRNLWTAANFGVAYAALLDALNVAMPTLEIYCQTPTVMTSEAANGLGSTLPNYRTQIETAVSTRTGFCTLVDGSAIILVGDLGDTVHPNTTGHGKIAAHYISLFGL